MSTRLTLEIASNSLASALAAQAGGADRIELFDNLAEGGTTTCSSEELAAAAGVNSAKLRKDLSYLGSYGTRGVGYDVEYLRYQIAREIGVTQDCTMLVTNSLKAVGINHHGWPASYKSLGTQVSAAEAQAGDIAYYANGGSGSAHVAIYAGNGQAIHGGWNGSQTVKASVNVGSGPEFIRVS